MAARLWKLKVLIVDEISMVSGELFQALDAHLRKLRGSEEPFGGIQLILSGDFFQCGPLQHTSEPTCVCRATNPTCSCRTTNSAQHRAAVRAPARQRGALRRQPSDPVGRLLPAQAHESPKHALRCQMRCSKESSSGAQVLLSGDGSSAGPPAPAEPPVHALHR